MEIESDVCPCGKPEVAGLLAQSALGLETVADNASVFVVVMHACGEDLVVDPALSGSTLTPSATALGLRQVLHEFEATQLSDSERQLVRAESWRQGHFCE